MDWRIRPSLGWAALGLAACLLSGMSARAAESTLTIARAEEIEEVSARLRASLRSALETGESGRAQWQRLTWQGIDCYEPAAVARTLDRMKSDIDVATSTEPRLSALQVYVSAKLDAIGRMPPTLIITERSETGPVRQLFGVRADQADASWRELRGFAQNLAEMDLVTDLIIASDPRDAKIALQVVSHGMRRVTLPAEVQVYNLWRGAYRLTAERPGYKSAVLDVELIGQRSAGISCTLAKARSADKSRCVQEKDTATR
jgi:hypothetical protein